MVVHIVGGGLAGLSAAVSCLDAGLQIRLYESAPRLGGRCASWNDTELGGVIDNGTHAVVRGNRQTMGYLRRIGARDRLIESGLQMFDIASGRTFSPLSTLRFDDLAAALSLMLARPGTTADRVVGSRVSRDTFWEPLCTAVLNTPLEAADARLLGSTISRMVFSFTPWLAATSLADTYVRPAEHFIRARGGQIFLADAVTGLVRLADRITALTSREATHPVAVDDQVILALPPWAPLLENAGLAPVGLAPSPIVNAHYRVAMAARPRFVGLVGGAGQWLLHRGEIATVTVSAADTLIEQTDAAIAQRLWADVAEFLGADQMPAYRVIKERRATIRHTPESQSPRSLSIRVDANVVLAGDWTQPSMPCTIEAAIASGVTAARAVRTMS